MNSSCSDVGVDDVDEDDVPSVEAIDSSAILPNEVENQLQHHKCVIG